jgi:hypothetical protein
MWRVVHCEDIAQPLQLYTHPITPARHHLRTLFDMTHSFPPLNILLHSCRLIQNKEATLTLTINSSTFVARDVPGPITRPFVVSAVFD